MENYVNDYLVSVGANIDASATTLVVSVAATIASGFRIIVGSELMLVTAGGTTTSWTVTRQIESTSAASHNAGDLIHIILTAGALDALRAQMNQVGTYANLPSTGMKAGDRYVSTTRNAEFIYDGTKWNMNYSGLIVPGPFSAMPTFAWSNQAGASAITESGDTELLVMSAAGGNSVRGRGINVPGSTPWTITTCLHPMINLINYNGAGLFLTDGSKVLVLAIGPGGASVSYYSGFTTYSSTPLGITGVANRQFGPVMARITDNGTNHIFGVSGDGVTYQTAQQSRTAFFTATKIGYYVEPNSGTLGCSIRMVDWRQS